MNLFPFQELIQARTGIFFEKSRLPVLENGIISRMSEEGISTSASYLNHLNLNADELGNLIMLLTVNETYFFREKEQISLAIEKLLPKILKKKRAGQEIRIFCAGCSSGEEPYSIIMALQNFYGKIAPFRYKILAVDIDKNALVRAKRGFYRKHSFRSFDFINMKKFLSRSGTDGYTVNNDIKKHAEFIPFNLNTQEYPKEFFGIDIVFYRNVSIYFKCETQRSIFENLAQILNPEGYLIMGATETFAHNFSLLSLTEYEKNYIFRKDSPLTNQECE